MTVGHRATNDTLQGHDEQSQKQCPQPLNVIELDDQLAQPFRKTARNTDAFAEIVARPQEQLILLLIRQRMGIYQIPKHEHADAKQHRQPPFMIFRYYVFQNDAKIQQLSESTKL